MRKRVRIYSDKNEPIGVLIQRSGRSLLLVRSLFVPGVSVNERMNLHRVNWHNWNRPAPQMEPYHVGSGSRVW